tara:strand:- start:540 stop:1508 length:969 start_codon:yes stop_codon:yes gene_type:complete
MKEESAAILEAAKRLNNNQVEKTLILLEECFKNKKKLLLTGVGKSGIVARKLAATFSSIGLTSIYLNPLDALHGDLGIVDQKDLCILLSNSGETQELIQLIPHLRNKGSIQIGILGNLNSTLALKSNVFLDASVNKEVCPLNLAPTASTTVAMAIGDALAVVLMEKMGISRQDFAINHPAGKLGRELTLKVSDLMKPNNQLNPLFKNSSFREIISEITRGAIGSCWIKERSQKNKLIGLITDGDLRRALKNYEPKEWENLLAEKIMTKDPIVISSDKFAIDALELMEKNRKKPISLLPVVGEDYEFIGILRLHDLIQAGLNY